MQDHQHHQNGEPNFAAGTPTIKIPNLHHLVKIGTYVTHIKDYHLNHGRIINVYKSRQDKVLVTVNKYLTQTESKE